MPAKTAIPKFLISPEIGMGIVTNQSHGALKLIPTGEEIKSANALTKYAEGTRLRVAIKPAPNGQKILLTAEEIDEFVDYTLTVEGEVSEPENLIKFLEKNVFESVNYLSQLPALLKVGGNVFPVTEPSDFESVFRVYYELTKREGAHDYKFNIRAANRFRLGGEVETNDLEWLGSYWIQPDARTVFKAVRHAVESGVGLTIQALGNSGYGKTQTAKALSRWLSEQTGQAFDIIRVNCATVGTTEEWFGYPEAKDGSTFFVPTRLTELLRRGNVIVNLDEYNRIEPWVANSLFPILDEDHETTVHNEVITLGPNVYFWLTANVGSQFSGTFTTDTAFDNRIDFTIFFDKPPADVEEEILVRNYPTLDRNIARRIITSINSIRAACERGNLWPDISTRTALKLAKAVTQLGMDLRDAVELAIINKTNQEERKAIIEAVNATMGPVKKGKR